MGLSSVKDTADLCAASCKATSDCKMFSYESSGKSCVLYNMPKGEAYELVAHVSSDCYVLKPDAIDKYEVVDGKRCVRSDGESSLK